MKTQPHCFDFAKGSIFPKLRAIDLMHLQYRAKAVVGLSKTETDNMYYPELLYWLRMHEMAEADKQP